MNRLAEYFFAVAITLWVGALWTVGFVAMILFRQLDHALAGALAAHLFNNVAWLGIGCACYVLIFLFMHEGVRTLKTSVFWFVLLMLLFTLASHFGVDPILARLKTQALPREVMESLLRNRFMAWHGVSSVLYLIESVLGIALVTQTFKR
ncbi:MAG TPA: DUF4149 domain-containing protein [Rhodocyclaceae bacterium]|nr:DUF4149 domain-containing protein [Rhodocyclaceae bacterium]